MGTNSPIRCVNFPSHIPEIWEQLTGHFGRFDQAVQAITAAIDEGGLVAVVHEVTAASIRAQKSCQASIITTTTTLVG